MRNDLKERLVSIGSPAPLSGILTEPAAPQPGRPAILILNSGALHRVGACRLSVRIARALAATGFHCLRYDGAGLGDSAPRRRDPGDQPVDAAASEAIEVMDHLETTGVASTFLLLGLCSGANASFTVACRDPRVVGIAMIDPHCYRTWRYFLRHYAIRLADAGYLAGFLRRLTRRAVSRSRLASAERDNAGAAAEAPSLGGAAEFFSRPPRQQTALHLQALVARSVKLLVCFTGGMYGYNYADQYVDSFPEVDFRNLLDLIYLPQANHVITQAEPQRILVDRIGRWAVNEFQHSGAPDPEIA